ncbi:YisL family protein [Pseudogracilibacillus auburnensis]|uniref:UPF0344 protein DFR56_10290 n=1 Tax=Pseudogracilibacillus auburnensis TaxID=1494959 RepID=A0A2V3W818_9BACI|nr:YisL family protein [Pseudogracilibacillus auburnensis]MBO1003626.1 YisL family protein [Pseudogracilibacillus auburnensis]PXW89314.1 uncharacterized protein DUF1516 [Pseudogracilibacillus auburnensis]
MAHLHITAWVLAFILLFVVTAFYKSGKTKPGKILHMILRLDYLLILYSGGSLFASYSSISGELIIKVIAGLWAIVAMEMITVRTNKGKPTKAFWIQFVVAALIAIILGFGRLPLGILP